MTSPCATSGCMLAALTLARLASVYDPRGGATVPMRAADRPGSDAGG